MGTTTDQLTQVIHECLEGATIGYVCTDWKQAEYCLNRVQIMIQEPGNWTRKTIKVGPGTIRFISVHTEPHTLVGYRAKYVFDHAAFYNTHWRNLSKKHDWEHFADVMNKRAKEPEIYGFRRNSS